MSQLTGNLDIFEAEEELMAMQVGDLFKWRLSDETPLKDARNTVAYVNRHMGYTLRTIAYKDMLYVIRVA